MTPEEIKEAMSRDTFGELKKFAEPWLNTLVLSQSYDVVRLVEVIDGDDDYYFKLDDWGKEIWSSCVGTFFPLMGRLAKEDYNEMARVWNMNNTDKVLYDNT